MALGHSESRSFVDAVMAMLTGKQPESSTSGVITRVDKDGTAWARFAGSSSETPCRRTAFAVEVGDSVGITVGKGVATIDANYSRPATDDKTAVAALEGASSAEQVADMSRQMAESAIRDAESASDSAQSAAASANSAQQSADAASENARKTFSYLLEVEDDWEAIGDYRDDAESTLVQIGEYATSASANAESALHSAQEANATAVSALMQLSTVEDVVGALNWITEHGSYLLTADEEVVEGKTYYTLEGGTYALTSDTELDPSKQYYESDGEGGYDPVASPDVEDIASYYERSGMTATPVSSPSSSALSTYFELSISESVQHYIASHLAQTDHGLDLMMDGSDFRMHLGTMDGTQALGTYILGTDGIPVAKFTTSGAVIGRPVGAMHVELTPERLAFVDPSGNETAHIAIDSSGFSVLYITRTVVAEDMRFGNGNWKWYSRANGNMALKWMGS